MRFSCVVAFAVAIGTGTAMAQDVAAPGTAPAAASSRQTAPAGPTAAAEGSAQNATGAVSPPPVSAPAGTLPWLSGDATKGQAKAAVCGACHGIDGNSGDAQYPKLAGQNAHYIVEQLNNFKQGRRQNPIMLGFASQLSEQDMYDIAAYFAGQTVRPGVADEKQLERGRRLYRQGAAEAKVPACMACHGPDGRGNPGAPYPQLAGQHADYIQKTLTAWHDGTVWGDNAHAQIMPAIAKRLSTDDIAAVSSYIEGLHGTVTAPGGGHAAP